MPKRNVFQGNKTKGQVLNDETLKKHGGEWSSDSYDDNVNVSKKCEHEKGFIDVGNFIIAKVNFSIVFPSFVEPIQFNYHHN